MSSHDCDCEALRHWRLLAQVLGGIAAVLLCSTVYESWQHAQSSRRIEVLESKLEVQPSQVLDEVQRLRRDLKIRE